MPKKISGNKKDYTNIKPKEALEKAIEFLSKKLGIEGIERYLSAVNTLGNQTVEGEQYKVSVGEITIYVNKNDYAYPLIIGGKNPGKEAYLSRASAEAYVLVPDTQYPSITHMVRIYSDRINATFLPYRMSGNKVIVITGRGRENRKDILTTYLADVA